MSALERTLNGSRAWWLVALLLVQFPGAMPATLAKDTNTAALSLSGYGFLGNRKLKKTLELLGQPGKKPEFYDANFVEDSALILMSRLNRDGYLKPHIQ